MRYPSAILLLLLGCGDPESVDPSCETSMLRWENTGGIVLGYCAPCHGQDVSDATRQSAPSSVNLDTYDGVYSHRERVHARVLEGTMPPGGGLTDTDVALLDEWLRCGAR